ncbi:hypothetical protein QVD17_18988 [Tagetes erecta]|uniref:phosphoglycolate phosphatase n=1 Tax=Tagetes erecta TaxID=13708 RepID=A0AAD8KLR2_TARER|nr:hypothetical protein QVD17_18988 [Tagetes erecta]
MSTYLIITKVQKDAIFVFTCEINAHFSSSSSPSYFFFPLMADDKSTTLCQPLSLTNVQNLLDSVDCFLFDCDGVIWKGDTLIDGVPQTLEMLRSKGKKLVFVTNNSSKSRKQYAHKFQSLGIPVTEEEMFSSSFAATMYLKVNEFPPEKKVYVIGGEGIIEELKLAGFIGLGGPEDGKKTVQLKANTLFEHDKSVGAVVVGIDPYINYYKLQYGTLCIRENPGCIFIATNRDATGNMTDLQEWPGAGCMVRCCNLRVNGERAYCSRKTFHLFNGLFAETIQYSYN